MYIVILASHDQLHLVCALCKHVHVHAMANGKEVVNTFYTIFKSEMPDVHVQA